MPGANVRGENIPVKPLLRGWLHACAAVVAAVVGIALCWLSRDDPAKLLSMLVFGVSMVLLYTVSALYHMGNWRPKAHRVLRALDHSNIYVVIAGTYTPLCFNVLSGGLRAGALLAIWLLAVLGIGLAVVAVGVPRASKFVPRWARTVVYIGMGWVAVILMPALLAALPLIAIGLLVLGGILNTVGALIYALRRPNPFPRVFGFHEIFHLLVIAGGTAFTLVIWLWVLPFPRD